MKQYKNSIATGNRAEQEFIKIAKKKGVFKRHIGSDDPIQYTKHIDVYLEIDGEELGVDVKAAKNISRGQNDNSQPIWIEFKNVKGNKGWILGEAVYIAFEHFDHFLIFKRDQLLEWSKVNIDFSKVVNSSRDAYKKAYQRAGRKDLISFVHMHDIKHLICRRWEKIKEGLQH